MRKMTREYAALCMRAGYLAAAIDAELARLGKPMAGQSLIQQTRARAWTMTENHIRAIKRRAIQMGVDPDVLRTAEKNCAAQLGEPGFLDRAIELQACVDRGRMGRGNGNDG